MSEWTPNQIRELIEQAIKAERNLRDRLREEDRERFDDYKKSVAEALRVQASEYERRLRDLNNEAKRIQEFIKITVSQDSWTPHLKQFAELRERVTSQDSSSREMAVILGVIYSAIIATIAAAGALINFWHK